MEAAAAWRCACVADRDSRAPDAYYRLARFGVDCACQINVQVQQDGDVFVRHEHLPVGIVLAFETFERRGTISDNGPDLAVAVMESAAVTTGLSEADLTEDRLDIVLDRYRPIPCVPGPPGLALRPSCPPVESSPAPRAP